MSINMLHFLNTMVVKKTRETLVNSIGEEILDDLIEMEILLVEEDLVRINPDIRETILQATTFQDYLIKVQEKFKREGRME